MAQPFLVEESIEAELLAHWPKIVSHFNLKRPRLICPRCGRGRMFIVNEELRFLECVNCSFMIYVHPTTPMWMFPLILENYKSTLNQVLRGRKV